MPHQLQPIRLEEFVMQEMQRLLDFSAYWKQQQAIAPHAKASLMPPQHWQEEMSCFPEEEEDEFGEFAQRILNMDVQQCLRRARIEVMK